MARAVRSFRRLVLALQLGAATADVRFAAEMARLLGLDLLTLMVDDFGLANPEQLPFAREFRGPIAGWRPADPNQIKRDLDAAAQNLRRSVESVAQELEAKAQFQVISGPLADTIRAVSRADDILLLAEPANPAERASAQFNWLTEAVLQSQAAALLVPARLARRKGAVVAIAVVENDPAIDTAAEIAAACGEELAIIDSGNLEPGPTVRGLTEDERLRVKRFSAAHGAFADPTLLNNAFRHLQERLVVMTRGAFDESVPPTITSARRVPVLMVEPELQKEPSHAQYGNAAGTPDR